MDGETPTAAAETRGGRLAAFVHARWPRSQRGIRGLAAAMGVAPDTIYSWFRNESEPSPHHQDLLAEALKVRRYQIVAAMDGDAPVVGLDEAAREALREELLALLVDPDIRRRLREAGVA